MALDNEYLAYTYAAIMADALSQVPDTVDKREGSIIYDALGPACYKLAEFYLNLQQWTMETYLLTATGEWLDLRAAEYGIERLPATAAVKRGDFTDKQGNPMTITIGSRFATVSTTTRLTYVVTSTYPAGQTPVPGAYELTCEQPGTAGHEYTGPLSPIGNYPSIGSATMSTTITPGRDVETDESLRQRYIDKVNFRPFGGNIADYRNYLLEEVPGIGAVQVYPIWNGGGTVKTSIVDTTFMPVSDEFLAIVQNQVDPDNMPAGQGMGLGTAPIGHVVTVTTPSRVTLDVVSNVTLMPGYTLAQIKSAIDAAIEVYFASVRSEFGTPTTQNEYSQILYVPRVTSAILGVPGVANATGTTVGGQTETVELVESGATQELPILGTVTINA